MMNRDAALEPVLVALSHETGCSREWVRDCLADWRVVPYVLDGEVAACAILKGTEIHFAVAPGQRRRLLTRTRIREFLAPLLAQHGYLTTRMLSGHGDLSRDILFIRRLGFRKTWTAGDVSFYMLTCLPYERVST